jgi:flagellar basal body-associated protein FliL
MEEDNTKKKSGSKKLIIFAIVFVGLIIASYFLIFKPYMQEMQKNAIQYGFEYAVNAMAQAVATCNPVPIPYGNVTINITAVGCN